MRFPASSYQRLRPLARLSPPSRPLISPPWPLTKPMTPMFAASVMADLPPSASRQFKDPAFEFFATFPPATLDQLCRHLTAAGSLKLYTDFLIPASERRGSFSHLNSSGPHWPKTRRHGPAPAFRVNLRKLNVTRTLQSKTFRSPMLGFNTFMWTWWALFRPPTGSHTFLPSSIDSQDGRKPFPSPTLQQFPLHARSYPVGLHVSASRPP